MRRLCHRPEIPAAVSSRLARETQAIIHHVDPKSEALRRYGNARKANWFAPVVKVLKKMAGAGERCMFCSGSEASDVEHFRPKAVFPREAMAWQNYLWTCAICNRAKGDRFPPDTEPGGQLVNPVEEDPWEFFFIDEFGLLTPLHDGSINAPNLRAVSTRDILNLGREALQSSRLSRLNDLKRQAAELIAGYQSGDKAQADVRRAIKEWCAQPFQADVADFFLRGPGRNESPFCALFEIIEDASDGANAPRRALGHRARRKSEKAREP